MSAQLGTLSVGSSVYLNLNGAKTEFIIVHQGLPSSLYDASCDGTWLLTKDIFARMAWNTTDNNDYANSGVHATLNDYILDMFDIGIQSAIKQVKLPYTNGTGSGGSLATGSSGISAKIFLLSYTEVGFSGSSYANIEGAVLDYFNGAENADRVANFNGTVTSWWLRSPDTSSTDNAWDVYTSGTAHNYYVTNVYGVRPALVLPPTLLVSDGNDVVAPTENSAPSAPSSIAAPSSVNVGERINVSCGSASDPDGDAIAYIFERSYNGGAWEVVQSSSAQSFAETALENWTTVQYRVYAADSAGNTSDHTIGDVIAIKAEVEPDQPGPSDGFLQAIKNKAPQDIRLEFVDGSVIDKNSISITSGGLTYTEILNGDTDMTFGRAVMSELSAVLVNAGGEFTDFDFEREFTARIGVKVGDAFEYVKLGVFKGERPEKVRGKLIDFTAHDRMSLFDKSAETFADGLTFPCTLGEIYTKLCDFCGVGYVSAAFTNSDKSFDANPLEGTDYTCREILAYIAEAAGSYARMSRDGAVELVWFAEADYTVTRTDRFEMTESEFETPPVDKLEVYNSYGDQLNTSGTGDIVYGISDNPFLYIENDTQLAGLQPYVDAIYNRIASLPAYHPSSFRAEFNPAVQCGDIISVVDDYDTTISFPVFVQTITWNGFGKTTYENTGGVIRQNAPFTQRELEQIKKKSLRATDLYTTIDSYLSSEEGIASITQAVGGKFITQDDLAGYAKTTEVSTQIKQEISAFEASITLEASMSSSPTETEIGSYASFGGEYEFEKTSDGYYTSTNAGVASSYSYCMWGFNDISTAKTVTIRCISYGENNFDYGIISALNSILEASATEDTENVLHSFKGESSPDPVDITLDIPAGTSYITLKYIKDGSADSNGDYFKFKVLEILPTTSQTSVISIKSGGITLDSAEITFTGIVTFESLATAGATTINGANITTGKISADRIDTSTLYAKQVLLNTDEGDYPMVSSELSSTNNTAYVKVGVTEDNGWAQFVDIYGTYIRFGRPGYDAGADDNGIIVDMPNMQVAFNDNNAWMFGTPDSELGYVWARRHGFYDHTYLRVTNSELRFYYPVGENVDGEFGYEYDYITILEYSGI